MTLFEIDNALLEFDYDIDPETGEILNADELDTLQMARETKIENVALWYKNLKAEAEAVKAEKNIMADRQRKLENKAESLKNYLTYALSGEKFSTPKVAISYRKSTSVDISPTATLDNKWLVQTVTTKPDRNALKEALKAGEKIEGVQLLENNNIQVK